MATIIRENVPVIERSDREVVRDGSGPGTGFVVGLILIVLLAILFFAYGLPAIRNASSGRSATLNVNVNKDAGSAGNTTGGSNYSGGTQQ